MATFCNMAYTWDANKNKTSESITGVMSSYGFTAAGRTAGNEDLCFSSSLPPPASSLLIDIDTNDTADVNFQYDSLGRRVARSGTGGSVVYVQMDQQTIADYPVGGAATTPTFRYVYASYIDEPVVRKGPTSTSTVHFYHRKHQYSITAVTTSAGSVAERYAYSAYGQPTVLDASGATLQTSNFSLRTSYTGREWDATLGLHHFRARWMSPSAGRFLGRDPIGYEGSKWFLYEFLRSKSLKGIDPSGLICQEDRKPPEHCCPLAFEETPDIAECFNNPSPISRDKGCKYKDSTCFAIRDRNGNPQSWPISCVCKHKIWADNDPTIDCIRGCLQCVHDKSGKTPGMELHGKCIFECANRHNSDDWLGLYPTRAIVRLMIFTMLV